MKKKILITDFDGTFSPSRSIISEGNLKAVKRYTDAGGIFTVCTGRMKMGILPILKDLGISGTLICFNGAEITDIETGETLFKKYISNDKTVKALEILDELGAYVHSYYDDKLVIEKRIEHTKQYEDFSRLKATVVGEKLSVHYKNNGKETAKFYVYDTPEFLDKAYVALTAELSGELNIIRSNPLNIEITDKTVSKGNAVKMVLNLKGLTEDDLVTVGDGGNDAPMLKLGYGIAVKNAVELAKNSAKSVLPYSCEEDAIRHIIDEYCM